MKKIKCLIDVYVYVDFNKPQHKHCFENIRAINLDEQNELEKYIQEIQQKQPDLFLSSIPFPDRAFKGAIGSKPCEYTPELIEKDAEFYLDTQKKQFFPVHIKGVK